MALGATAMFLVGACFGAAVAIGAAIFRARARRVEDARLEVEIEKREDALWRLTEAAETARREAAREIADALARAEDGARAKAKFLATVTHEMRTPLSGVIGTTELLLDTALAPDQQTYARAVKASAEAMLSLVDEILDLSRMEAGTVALQEAPFALADLAEGVAELLAPRAHAKGLDLAVHVAAGAPATVVGDAARIRQVLMNLLGNAIKFTESGGVGLRVEAGEGELRFVVADTGPGFAAEDAERLFEEFQQNEAGSKAGGAGLGLAISRRLAHAMGGALSAVAEPGAGATFTLALPARDAARHDRTTSARPLAGRRVVVASAAPFGGPWLVESLAEWGADATLCAAADAGSVEAAARVADAEIAVVETSETGDRAEALAAAARRGGAARVLILVAPSERGRLPTLAADGFVGYLVKPVRAASLVSRLDDPRSGLAQTSAPRIGTTAGRGRRLAVLLAEDDAVSALIALAQLSRLDHGARHVGDGLAACEAFERDVFDVALLDVRMPALDGLGAARRMRAHEAETGRPPALLIALTANASDADRAAALEAGFDALLGKPLDRKALEELLAPREAGAAQVA